MRPPYPVEIAPLLSQFLTRRRAKMTFPLRQMEALGLDRPTYFWVVNVSYRGPRGAAAETGDLESPYATIRERWMPMAAVARGAGLAEERDGRWHLTAKGKDLARRQHEAAREHYAMLKPLPEEELAELARLLDRAFDAAARAAQPRERMHTPLAFAYRGDAPPDGSFAQLDAAVFGLWQVRDDCHVAAWRAAGLAGPDVEVLTRIWRKEATNLPALAELLPHQSREDVAAAVERLRTDGSVAGDPLHVTDRGAQTRKGIEEETDRLFFGPWPDDVGAKGPWIAERLAKVNTALT